MTLLPQSRNEPVWRFRTATWLPSVPIGAALVFAAVIGLAYSPGVLVVHGIHGDYEMLVYRGTGFLHPEAGHLFAIGRPVSALLTNLTILPLQSLSDFRWVRIFSILTVCILGIQMMSNCIVRLRTTTLDALALALSTFLVLPFIYSVSNPAAWAPHLLTILFAFGAYAILGRSNLQAIPFLILVNRGDWWSLPHQARAYACHHPVLTACLVYQLALYDYPPSALILAVFPVIGVLFSRAPPAYRTLIAVRDILFLGVNLALYAAFTKLVYLPVGRFFLEKVEVSADPFIARLAASYQYALITDPGEILARVGRLARVAGDLWFLPQLSIHFLTGVVLLLAIITANGTRLFGRHYPRPQIGQPEASAARLKFDSWTSGAVVTVLVVGVCFLVSGAPVLTSAGGFISYRTIVVSIALVAIVFLYGVRVVAEVLLGMALSSYSVAMRGANGVMMLVVAAALAGSFYANYATMKLSRNEFAYFTGIVKQAIESKSKTIFFLDPRPLTLPEDNPVIFDQQGRAIPPYELGCLSAYCLQSGAIMHVAAAELGRPVGAFSILTPRGDYPVPGLTCPMLTSPTPSYPPHASAEVVATIDYYRTLTPLMCETHDLKWHDLGAGVTHRPVGK